MTRRGKIARLPGGIREELNQRLENGEQGARLVEWLNGLPEVQAVLAQDFEGQAINEVNLTQWRKGGFLDWQAWRRALECGVQSAECGMEGVTLVAESLVGKLMAHYAVAVEDAIAETDEKPGGRVERLGRSLRDVVRVRRYDMERERDRERAEIDKERVRLERERIELQRAKFSKRAPGTDAGKPAGLSHQEKAEMVKQMVRDARAEAEEERVVRLKAEG